MAFFSIPDSWIQVGQAITQRLFQAIKDNEDTINSTVGTLQGQDILNGFFEIVEDIGASPLRPTSWDITEYLGGTVELDDTVSTKGKYALTFNHPGGAGNGGGEAESDYYPISENTDIFIGQTFWSTLAGVRIKVEIDYFDEDKIFIIASTEILYNETTNPTAKTRFTLQPTFPAGARYLKWRFIGGDTDTDPGGSADIILDEVHVNYYDDASIPQNKLVYLVGGNLINSNNNVASTNNTGYTKLKETRTSRSGVLTVDFSFARLGGVGGDIVRARVYINGVAVGTEHTTTSTTYQIISADYEVAIGDNVQIYARSDVGGTRNCNVKDFRFKNLYLDDEVNILT